MIRSRRKYPAFGARVVEAGASESLPQQPGPAGAADPAPLLQTCRTAAGNYGKHAVRNSSCCLRVLCYRNRTPPASGQPIVPAPRAGAATLDLLYLALRHLRLSSR